MRILILLFILSIPQISLSFDTTKIIFHYHGPTNDAKIGLKLHSLKDINNDGFDDIAVSSQNPFGSYVFYGGNPVDSFPDMFLNGHIETDPIDLDGDGIDDLISIFASGDNFGAIYFYKGYVDSLASLPYDSLYPIDSNYAFGWDVRGAYVDNDSLGDFLTSKRNTPGGPTLYYYSGCPALDTIPEWSFKVSSSHDFSDFGFIDFNGDGNLDIFLGRKAWITPVGEINIFLGPNFATQPDIIINPPEDITTIDTYFFATEIKNVSDVNGDNWEDLGVLFGNYCFIYLGGPGADTLYDYQLIGNANEFSKAGDINGDGFNDLLSGDSRTFWGIVDVFVGGDEFDSQFDESIYEYHLPSISLERIGFELAPAGDFNNDGWNDFMFSCRNTNLIAPWDVFLVNGGPYLVTDIEYNHNPVIPEIFELKQNYPNPFNPTTTIEFSLTTRQYVKLEVFNILGERVITLLDKQLRAGKHIIEWDGKDIKGNTISSGVYLYRLTTDDSVQSRKMLLLK